MTGSTIMMTCSLEDLQHMIREVVMDCMTNSNPQPENKLLTRNEVCDILHIGSTTLSKFTKDGIIQGCRIGKRVLYLETDVRAALREMPNRQRWKKTKMEDEDDVD
jgi:hypothetical protein